MSNILAAFKTSDQIVSNLLDQTKFTNPEIEYLVKGLDSNLDPKDSMSKILKTNEHVSVISDLSDKQSFDTEPVKRLSSQVVNLINQADRLLKIEDDARSREQTALADARQRRARERELDNKAAQIKLDQIRESLLAEELELERKYLKLEESLRAAGP